MRKVFYTLVYGGSICLIFRMNADAYGTHHTPNGTCIESIIRTFELTPIQIASYTQAALNSHPGAYLISDASRIYNCHAFAWAGLNSVCLNTQNIGGLPNLAHYWMDFSFVWAFQAFWMIPVNHVLTMTSAYPPPLILHYASSNHSAVFIDTEFKQNGSIETWVLSKWGEGPLMFHRLWDSPYDATVELYGRVP